jgi:hypothetical protein
MKKQLIFCLLVFSFSFGIAQIPYPKTLSGHIEFGPSFYNLDALNDVLTRPDSGYLPFPEPMFGFGFGMDYNSNRWIVGGAVDAYVFSAPGLRTNRFQLSLLNYYYAKAKVGYVIYFGDLDSKPFLMFPSVGVGGGFSRLRSNSRGGNIFAINKDWGHFYDFALNMHWFPPISDTESSHVKLGLSIGYMYAPGKGWDLSGFNEGERLKVSPQGFYVRLIFGMAGGL